MSESRRLIKRPPSLLVLGVGVAAFAAIMVATSGPTPDLLVFAAGALVGLAALVVAVLAFFQAVAERFDVRRASAVAVTGFILAGLAFGLPARGAPASIRFSLSLPAFNAAAAHVLGGDSVGPGWIGLYPVALVTRVSSSTVEFDLTSPGLDVTPTRFVFTTAIVPPSVDGMDTEDLGQGWWMLTPSGGD